MAWRLPTIPEVFDAIPDAIESVVEDLACLTFGHEWNRQGVCDECGVKR